jgi:hypothetical protein
MLTREIENHMHSLNKCIRVSTNEFGIKFIAMLSLVDNLPCSINLSHRVIGPYTPGV